MWNTPTTLADRLARTELLTAIVITLVMACALLAPPRPALADAAAEAPGGSPLSIIAPCAPRHEIATRTAVIRSLSYIVTPQNRPIPLGNGCTDEGTARIPLTVTSSGCEGLVVLDFMTLKATETMRLVYDHPALGAITAFGCGTRPESRVFDLVESIAGCRMEHDFESGRTEALVVWTFDVDGEVHRAGGCFGGEDGRSRWFDHVYQSCDPITVIDPTTSAEVMVPQQRTVIPTTPALEIVSCQPVADPSPSVFVGKIVAGEAEECAGVYVDDPYTSATYGTRKMYRISAEGGEGTPPVLQDLTDCVQDPSVVYRHAYVQDGWRNDDAVQLSWTLTRIQVETPQGIRVLNNAVELESAVPHSPVSASGEIDPTTAFPLGCETWAFSRQIRTFERPDGTTHDRLIGYGPAERLTGC